MIRILILSIFANSLIFSAFGQQLPQQWLRTFQGQGKAADRVAAITTDLSGNIYIAGYAGNHHGSWDAFAMKRDPQGDTLWTYYYDGGTNDEDYATAIVVDNAGNTYITGQSENTPSNDECFTAKLLPSGTEAWVSRYSPGGNMQSKGNALAVDANGNVYVAGYSDPLSGSSDWLVIKYNSSGVQQWVDVFNGPGNGDDEAMGIALAPNGNPTVCGYVYDVNASGNINAFVKQYTPSNGTVWTDTWTNPLFTGMDKAHAIGFNAVGEIFVGGETKNSVAANQDAFAIKYDAAGNPVWETIYTDATSVVDEYFLDVVIDATGNVFFCGSDYQDGFVTRINNDGTQGWRKEFAGTLPNGYEVFHGVTVDNAGNAYATGRGVYPGPNYYANGGMPNLVITKYNANGDSLWTFRSSDTLKCSMGFAVTARDGKVYAGGFLTDSAYVDENLYTVIVDTSGNAISEWSYNGRGDAITMGQVVLTDALDNVYCAATVDRLYALGQDVAIVKYNSTGDQLWEKYFTSYGWNNDSLTGMKLDPSGNLILSIATDSAMTPATYRLSLLKVDPDGNFLDTAYYPLAGNSLAKGMAVRLDGSVALIASSMLGAVVVNFDAGFNPGWIVKIDSAQFVATRINSIDLFLNGDVVIGGFSQVGTNATGLVQRYNSTGAKLWSTVIDSVGVFDEVRDVTIDAAGDIAFTGASGGTSTFGALIGKLNGGTGNLLWKQLYNPATNNEYGVKVRFTTAGNIAFIARGYTGFVARYYTVQYSGSGVFQWGNIYSSTASDREPVDLIVEPSNRVVSAGWAINGFTTNYDYVITGYTSSGAVDFTNTYSHAAPVSFTWDQLYDMARDSQGDFIVTGRSSQEFYNNFLYKMVTIKYGGIPVGFEEFSQGTKSNAVIYPNPSATGRFTLLDASPYPVVDGKIYNAQGKLITNMDQADGSIDLSDCRPGLYVLVLHRKNTPAETIRLIIN